MKLLLLLLLLLLNQLAPNTKSQWAGHPTQEPGITAEANCTNLDIR